VASIAEVGGAPTIDTVLISRCKFEQRKRYQQNHTATSQQ